MKQYRDEHGNVWNLVGDDGDEAEFRSPAGGPGVIMLTDHFERLIDQGIWDELPAGTLASGEKAKRLNEKLQRLCEAYGGAFGELYKYSTPRTCNHEFVNMGFMHLKLVCKHCNAEKDS